MSKTFDQSNLQQRWIQILRAKNKSTSSLTCPLCAHRPAFRTEAEVLAHLEGEHATAIPQDARAAAAFRENILALAKGSRDGSLIPRPPPALGHTERGLTNDESLYGGPDPVPLTTRHLKDFDSKKSAGGEAGALYPKDPAFKKQAVGQGKSPSSSVNSASRDSASHSNLQAASSPSTPTKTLASEHETFQRGPTSHGKRLYDPSDTPRNLQASTENINVNARAVNFNGSPRPLQYQRARGVQQSSNQPLSITPAILPRSPVSFPAGTFPAEILNSARTSLSKEKSGLIPDHQNLISQPETRPISQEQLVAEVKGIYAGLVMVEGKCIQVDLKQAQLVKDSPSGNRPKLNNEQYQALIALHRTLLHEHHDFFLASQHPSATPAVRRLAVKYAMPARLWRHGIHSFLELLRNRLPESLDYMLAFIYLAYSMMTLLLETVPSFEDTWVECLGDLGRYRMAIEDDNIRDREVWTQVSRQWYLKSANKSPTTGRLYHHLAILARPDALPQLLYYGKSLAVPVPFTAARESIMTLFEPALNPKPGRRRFSPVITAYVRCHAIIFTEKDMDSFSETLDEFISLLDGYIARITKKYLEQGYFLALSNCIALLGYGSDSNPLNALLKRGMPSSSDRHMTGTEPILSSGATILFDNSLRLFNQTIKVHLDRIGDKNVLSFLHVTLVFMIHMCGIPSAIELLEVDFPWQSLVTMLNTLLRFYERETYHIIEGDQIPKPEKVSTLASLEKQKQELGNGPMASESPEPAKDEFRPFPEEWAMQGLPWTQNYFPQGWFIDENLESEKHYMEAASMSTDYRPERILWLGCRLAKLGQWIGYDSKNHLFYIPETASEEVIAKSPSENTLMDNSDVDEASQASQASTWNTNQAGTHDSTWATSQATDTDISMADRSETLAAGSPETSTSSAPPTPMEITKAVGGA